jgi:hypothetical protein
MRSANGEVAEARGATPSEGSVGVGSKRLIKAVVNGKWLVVGKSD